MRHGHLWSNYRLFKEGVTLLELLVVLIIIGVLATIAIPSYNATVETARGAEAKSVLLIIRAAEKMYFVDNGEFLSINSYATGPWATGRWESLGLDHPNLEANRSFNYKISSADADNFTAVAERLSGSREGDTITIDKDGNFGGDWPYPL